MTVNGAGLALETVHYLLTTIDRLRSVECKKHSVWLSQRLVAMIEAEAES
jgi:hypothetical protein